MGAARKEFVGVALGDRDAHGYDEHTLSILLRLMESSAPDVQLSTHCGVMGYYLSSGRAIAAVSELVSAAETLRDGDSRFASLGIGLSRGPLIAEFDWRGRVKPSRIPVGETANKASAGVVGPQNYRKTLSTLHGATTV
jgi:hypothetical protein